MIDFDRLKNYLPKEHFESTETNVADSWNQLHMAERHWHSATILRDLDPAGSFQLLYDAARKTLQALLAAGGIRITSAGGHYAFVRVAELDFLEDESWLQFRAMRLIRNSLEYPNREIHSLTESELIEAIDAVSRMIAEAKKLLDQCR